MISTTRNVNSTKKSAFTLIEIIIVIIIISIVYSFVLGSFKKQDKQIDERVTLSNLKSNLLKMDYTDSIEVVCLDDDFKCFLYLDDEKQEINKLFSDDISVYKYSKELEHIEYNNGVIFTYSCDKYQKCSEIIVEKQEKIYIFNDIHKNPILIDSVNDVNDYFEKKIDEVKDAF